MRQALGKRINQLRKSKGLTSEQLSELCGVNAVHIRRIESGGSLPSFSLFLKICNVLGTSADYLLGDLLEHPVIPDSVEQLGKQLKHLEPDQIDMINEMVEVYINCPRPMWKLIRRGCVNVVKVTHGNLLYVLRMERRRMVLSEGSATGV
jgi:transcriptional regulator with XRE-family HTH domain